MSNSLIRILIAVVLIAHGSSKAGAWVVDVATLIALLWACWPTPEIAGA